MGEVESARITCDGCNRTYAWKPELAGKRVKCKCGHSIEVPAARAPAQNEDDMYDLAPSEEPVKPKRPPMQSMPSNVGGQAPAVATSALPYQGPPVRDRMSNANLMDMNRDVYVPTALLAGGVLMYLACFGYRYHLSGTGIIAVSIALCVLTALKAGLLVGFALFTAGPLGVSFGGIWTATLKLAAIAVFCDGLTSWVDLGVTKISGGAFGGGGIFYGFISFPVALATYWALLIYLFSMDSGDSWMVVILLSVFDRFVKMALIFLVLGAVLHMGGVSVPGVGGGSAKLTTHSELDDRVQELQERQLLVEAKKYLTEPHNVNYLSPTIDEWYKAGAKTVYFQISRDINGHRLAHGLIIEMPEDKNQRQECIKIGRRVESGKTPAGPVMDDGDDYFEVRLD